MYNLLGDMSPHDLAETVGTRRNVSCYGSGKGSARFSSQEVPAAAGCFGFRRSRPRSGSCNSHLTAKDPGSMGKRVPLRDLVAENQIGPIVEREIH